MTTTNEYGYSRLGREEDLRQLNQESSAKREDMYDSLMNLILKHKMEMTKVPAASSLNTAQAWAQKRGLRAGERDLDGDGHPETVVFDKSGKPFIINGYKLKASDYPIRREYWSRHPTAEDRAAEPMREWIRDQAYDVRVNPENKWVNDKISKTQFGTNLKAWGYKMPAKPKKRLSPYSIFSKLIAPIVKGFLNSERIVRLCGDAAGSNNCLVIQKIVSPISVYRFLFLALVERPYFFELINNRNINANYSDFKKWLKDHKNAYFNWFVTNYLTGTHKEELNPNKISDVIVDNTLVRGELNWDETDVNDGIVFLLGGKSNMDDATTVVFVDNNGAEYHFEDLIFNDNAASGFLTALNDKSHPQFKHVKKALEKFKKRAQDKTKAYFSRFKEQFFQNQDALNTYQAASEAGVPLAPTEEAANEHLQQGGQRSPMRNTNQTADQPAQTEGGEAAPEDEGEEDLEQF